MLRRESSPLVLVPHLIGQTQTTADRKETSQAETLWTVDRLRSAYEALPDVQLSCCLRKVLDWATGQRVFREARRQKPMFAVCEPSGERIVSFFVDGMVYWFSNERKYPGGAAQRNRLMEELKALRMLDAGFEPSEAGEGKMLTRKLTDLNEDEFRHLLEVLACFCGKSGEKIE